MVEVVIVHALEVISWMSQHGVDHLEAQAIARVVALAPLMSLQAVMQSNE